MKSSYLFSFLFFLILNNSFSQISTDCDCIVIPGPSSCESFPYNQSDSFDPVHCWKEGRNGSLSGGPAILSNTNVCGWSGSFQGIGTSSSARISWTFVNYDLDWLISPEYDLTGGGPFDLTFDMLISSITNIVEQNAIISLVITTDGGSTWSTLQTWDDSYVVTNTPELITISLASYSGSNVQFGFVAEEGTGGPSNLNVSVYIDNVCVDVSASCSQPSGLYATAVDTISATLHWTDNANASLWDIEMVPLGNFPTGVPTVSGVTNPYVWTNAMPGTEYDFYVRADCGSTNGLSKWSEMKGEFKTLCGIVNPGALLCEDFSHYETLFGPHCWKEGRGGTITTGPDNFFSSRWGKEGFINKDFIGSAKVDQGDYSNTELQWLISREYDLTGGPFDLTLDVAVTDNNNSNPSNMGSDDIVSLLITSDSGLTWITLQTWDNTNTPSNIGESITKSLSAYSNMIVQFGFVGDIGPIGDPEEYDFFIDNMCIGLPTLCPYPSEFTVDNATITEVGAALSWTDNAGASLWDIEIVLANEEPTGIPSFSGVSNPFVWTGGCGQEDYQKLLIIFM